MFGFIKKHLKLKEELDKHGVSIQDVDKLLNLLSNAKENGFDPRLIVSKLCSIRRLEKKQERLKNSCEMLSKDDEFLVSRHDNILNSKQA